MIIIACVSAVATSWLVIIAIVVFVFGYSLILNDPTAGESVQLFILCFFVWPIAIVAGPIILLAAYLLFKDSYRTHPVLFSTIAGALGGLMPYIFYILFYL